MPGQSSERRDLAYLLDVLDSAELIVEYLGSVPLEEFSDNIQLQDSVAWRYQIIGEATANISDAARQRFGDVPWAEMRAMRNLIVHRYHRIDAKVLWDTAKEDLPRLIEQLRKVVPEKSDS